MTDSFVRLPIQVEGIIFCKTDEGIKYLLLKRSKKKGGFWQAITGGLEEGETLKESLLRELREETSINNIKNIIDTGFSFQFKKDNLWLTEYVYAIEVPEQYNLILSEEHEEYRWVLFEEALKLLKWNTNKEAFKKVNDIISKAKDMKSIDRSV